MNGATHASRATITAIGAVTSVGFDARTTCASIRAGIGRPSVLDQFSVLDHLEQEPAPVSAHPVDLLTRGFSHVGRWLQMAAPALEDLCRSAKLPGVDDRAFWDATLCLVVLPMVDEPRFLEAEHGEDDAALEREFMGPLRALVSGFFAPKRYALMTRGRIGVLEAFGLANEHFRAGHYERVAVLATDSLVDDASVLELVRQGRLKEDSNPVGLVPGEGSVAFMIEDGRVAKSRGATPLARIASVATDREPKCLAQGEQSLGEALARVVAQALLRAGVVLPFDRPPLTDLNGEKWRSEEFGHAMVRVPPARWNSTSVETPASSVGDVGAAMAALQIIIAARSLSRGYSNGDSVMVTSSDESGEVGAAIVVKEQ